MTSSIWPLTIGAAVGLTVSLVVSSLKFKKTQEKENEIFKKKMSNAGRAYLLLLMDLLILYLNPFFFEYLKKKERGYVMMYIM